VSQNPELKKQTGILVTSFYIIIFLLNGCVLTLLGMKIFEYYKKSRMNSTENRDGVETNNVVKVYEIVETNTVSKSDNSAEKSGNDNSQEKSSADIVIVGDVNEVSKRASITKN